MPSYTDIDVRLTRDFSVRERYHFEFRAEAFNLFNSTIVTAVNEVGFNYSTTGACAGAASATNTCIAPIAGGTNAIGVPVGSPDPDHWPLTGGSTNAIRPEIRILKSVSLFGWRAVAGT